MNLLAVITSLLLVLGVIFTLNIPPTLAQPCNNNAHGVLGSGKQVFKQSNRCVIVENNAPSSVCPPGSILENGVCVPNSSVCGPGSILQNGVCVPISPTQTLPIANAGPNQSVNGGTTVTLDGSGSFATTSDATIVSYTWSQSSEPFVTLTNPNSANPSFTAPPAASPFTLTFSLTVKDSNGLVSASSSVTITINP